MNNTKNVNVTKFLHYLTMGVLIVYVLWVALYLLGYIILIIDPHHKVGYFYPATTLRGFSPGGDNHLYKAVTNDPAFTVHMDLMGYFFVRTTSRVCYTVLLFYDLCYCGLYFLVFYQLHLLFGSIDKGNPFDKKNIRRIRLLGGGLIGAELLRIGFEYVAVEFIKGLVSVPGGQTSPVNLFFYLDWLNLRTFFTGLAILGIAEVFKVGVHLREEQELTI